MQGKNEPLYFEEVLIFTGLPKFRIFHVDMRKMIPDFSSPNLGVLSEKRS